MVLMIIAVLVVLGLCLGSFVNALVWRLHEQLALTAAKRSKHKPDKAYRQQLSITRGRSMCPHCKHELSGKDLVPVLSWLGLKGKCRYCRQPISPQYPLVELGTAALFIASYHWWPVALNGTQVAIFMLWLVLETGLMALLVYDLRWRLLPNALIYPLAVVAAAISVITVAIANEPAIALLNVLGAVLAGGGIFYIIFQVSNGKWIGGGDVRLGWLLGLVAATPARSLLFIFLAALGGSLLSLPLLVAGRLKRTSTIPFGPLLIIAAIIVQLFGTNILNWYWSTFITF